MNFKLALSLLIGFALSIPMAHADSAMDQNVASWLHKVVGSYQFHGDPGCESFQIAEYSAGAVLPTYTALFGDSAMSLSEYGNDAGVNQLDDASYSAKWSIGGDGGILNPGGSTHYSVSMTKAVDGSLQSISVSESRGMLHSDVQSFNCQK